MLLAMYKGKGKIGNYLTRWWTSSIYSHCEIVIDGDFYSASFMDGGVRKKRISPCSERWDFVQIDGVSPDRVLEFFDASKGKKYDWFGLLGSQIFNRRKQNPDKYFCSEWCADALGIPHPETFTPHTLLLFIEYLNKGRLK